MMPWLERFRGLPFRSDPGYVPDESEPFQQRDRPGAWIACPLYTTKPVRGAGGEGVVVVVPGLAETQKEESHQTFRDSSREAKRRRPKKWQIELIEKVT